jgi:transposase
MFPRIKKYHRKGTTYEYLVISESVHQPGKGSTTKDIGILGNIQRFKKTDIGNLIDGLIKIFQLEKYALTDEVEIVESLEYGSIIFWQTLWHELNLSKFIQAQLRGRNYPVELCVEKYVEMMTINRCIAPCSKLGLIRWLETTCYKEMTGYRDLSLDVNYFYRSMDYLLEMKAALELAIFQRLRNLFSVNVKFTFYDITSTFFSGENCPIGDHGMSRDKRPDCEQIVVGVMTSYEGYPLKHYVFQGNTTDLTTVPEVIKELKQDYHIEETIFVGDRGMISRLNLKEIEGQEFDYIMGVKMRQDALCQMLFSQEQVHWEDAIEYKNLKIIERTVKVKEFLMWKAREIFSAHKIDVPHERFLPFIEKINGLSNQEEPTLKDFTPLFEVMSEQMTAKIRQKIWTVIKRYKGLYEQEYRFVLCLNPERKASAKEKREAYLSKLSKELDEVFSEKSRKKGETCQTRREIPELEKAIHAIFEGYKAKFRKFFEIDRDPETKHARGYRLNTAAMSAEERLDGVFALLASRDDLAIAKVAESYKNLKEVEMLFDDLKNFVDIRPLRHWLETRVRAHVCICLFALLLKRIFEINYLGGKSVTEPLAEIEKAKLVKYKVKFSEREDRHQVIPKVTNLNSMQKKYFSMIGIKNPMNLEQFIGC